jgi:Flp pilus assembly protein TadD
VGVPDTFYMDNPLVAVGTGVRMATALMVIGKGAALLALPITLSPDYSFNAIPLVHSILDLRLLGALALLALSVWALLIPSLRRTPIPLVLSWYLLALLPTSNLILTVGTIFGERLLYLPGVAFCLSVGMGFAWAIRRYGRGATLAPVVILIALSIQTIRYSGAWESDISLFQWATASVPESTKAHHKLGEELLRAGDFGGALRSLRRALEIAPDNEFAAGTLSAARLGIARTYLSPMDGAEVPTSPPADPDLLYVLGQISQERGKLGQAESYWEGALALDPSHPESSGDLGVLRLMEADTTSALRLLRRAVRENPRLASAWHGLGRIHLARGEMREAANALTEFVEAAGPRHPEQVSWARSVLADIGGS